MDGGIGCPRQWAVSLPILLPRELHLLALQPESLRRVIAAAKQDGVVAELVKPAPLLGRCRGFGSEKRRGHRETGGEHTSKLVGEGLSRGRADLARVA